MASSGPGWASASDSEAQSVTGDAGGAAAIPPLATASAARR
jgi:hypothetical protein